MIFACFCNIKNKEIFPCFFVFFYIFSFSSFLISSKRVGRMSFSLTLLMTFPLAKIAPIPFPPATPISASRASPGPLTTHPITATLIGIFIFKSAFSTLFANPIKSISPQFKRLQDCPASVHFFQRISRERNAKS